ncbi:MAG: hypothetical protein KC549_03005 [Myxococcales bacterium]|nr:hypothetical protein [Myxococcales bacterium]
MTLATVLALALAIPPAAGLPPPAPRDASFRRGVALGLFAHTSDAAYQAQLYGQMLKEIKDIGATDVQLVVRWVQATAVDDTLGPVPGVTPEDAAFTATLAEARRLGLRVAVLPILHLQARPPGVWRGTLKPRDRARWWLAYRRFITHYARLSAGQAELFAVGSELLSMERDVAAWRGLIQEVRAVFPGQLTYSANWDHIEPVRFWGALDVMGVSAYWPLARAPGESEAAMAAAWGRFRRGVEALARRQGKPYLLTEVGFPAHAFGAVRPWDHGHPGRAEPAAQGLAWRATFRAWHDAPGLAGLYAWNWFGVGGPDDPGYSPRGREAEGVLRWWFGAAP